MIPVFLLCLVIGDTKPDFVRKETTDVVEINRYYDSTDGREIYTQVIWWDWVENDHYVTDWQMYQYITPIGDGKTYLLKDTRTGEMVEIRASSVFETDTFYDRELYDRNRLPQQYRRGLIR